MKKNIFAFIAGVAALASCQKEIQNYPEALSTEGGYKFEVEFERGDKSVKTGWENGDKVVAFFDDATTAAATSASAAKYVVFTFDGSGWEADQSKAPAASELGATGTVKAVYCPFGDGTVSAGDKAGEFYVSKSNAYFMQGSATYTKSGDKISFTMPISLAIENLSQILVPGLADTQKWSLSVYSNWTGSKWDSGLQKVWSAVFKPSTATFSAPTNALGKPTDGYKTADGYVFYGIASLGESKELTFELYDNTAKIYYTYKKTGVSKFSGNMAVKLPALENWTKTDARQVNLYADGTMIINENPGSRSGNILAHGPSQKVCDAITNLECATKTDETGALQPWASVRDSIKKVEFGSSLTPKSLWCAFQNCSELVSVNTANLNMSNCASLKYAFKGCKKLTTLDVSAWDTAKVNDLRYAFHDCQKLNPLDVSNWNVATVGNMYGAFRGCTSLEVLDMSKWSNSNITRVDELFRAMSKVKVLDISWVPCALIINTKFLFYQCGSLETIYAKGDLNAASNHEREFYQCSEKLKGGNGTVWSADNIEQGYARIDAAGTPGYFTLKQ